MPGPWPCGRSCPPQPKGSSGLHLNLRDSPLSSPSWVPLDFQWEVGKGLGSGAGAFASRVFLSLLKRGSEKQWLRVMSHLSDLEGNPAPDLRPHRDAPIPAWQRAVLTPLSFVMSWPSVSQETGALADRRRPGGAIRVNTGDAASRDVPTYPFSCYFTEPQGPCASPRGQRGAGSLELNIFVGKF